jgi:hypothetical protein
MCMFSSFERLIDVNQMVHVYEYPVTGFDVRVTGTCRTAIPKR